MKMQVFNLSKLDYTRFVVNNVKVDVKDLANFMVKKLLPDMVTHKESCFFWHNLKNDVTALTHDQYKHEIKRFQSFEYDCEKFDTMWQINFTMPDGTKMIAEITHEVWYDEDKDFPISPFAFIFEAPFAEGYMLSCVKFKKDELSVITNQ